MCIRRLLQSSHLQWARRATFLKHAWHGHRGALRSTHSGGSAYKAVIFDMGGVLIPSPGTVAAGEFCVGFHFWGVEGGGIEWRVAYKLIIGYMSYFFSDIVFNHSMYLRDRVLPSVDVLPICL